GPWPVQDGLPTMEIDRSLPIATQVNHLVLTGLIDDIIIGNAFASEEELAAVSRAFFANYPQIGIDTQNLSVTEKKALFDNTHLYRGDQSEYLLRDSITR
ncbi:MupG family TIM beta-alpha barrel fold protein, partial [Liquorilactobacillus vini]